jgi:hypothetical protein
MYVFVLGFWSVSAECGFGKPVMSTNCSAFIAASAYLLHFLQSSYLDRNMSNFGQIMYRILVLFFNENWSSQKTKIASLESRVITVADPVLSRTVTVLILDKPNPQVRGIR